MVSNSELFRKSVYWYCKTNTGRVVQFTIFAYLWPINERVEVVPETCIRGISPQDLVLETSRLVRELIDNEVLVEVEPPDKRGPYSFLVNHSDIEYCSNYPFFKILSLDL